MHTHEKRRREAVSRILSAPARPRPPLPTFRRASTHYGGQRRDDHSSSPAIAGGIKRPTRRLRTGRPVGASLFGLAPCGVLPATGVAVGAVRSYRTFSPLLATALRTTTERAVRLVRRAPTTADPRGPAPPKRRRREGGRYIFCATFLQVTLTGRYPAHCPAEFGLSSPPRRLPRRGRRGTTAARRSSGFLRQVVKELAFAARGGFGAASPRRTA